MVGSSRFHPLPPFRLPLNGAHLKRLLVDGRLSDRAMWTIGMMTVTESAIELGRPENAYKIPLAAISAIGASPISVLPPPSEFSQIFAVHHVERESNVISLVAAPAVTVFNFPLQLAAVLVGRLPAYLLRMSVGRVVGYEEATFALARDHIQITARDGPLLVAADRVTSLSWARRRDAEGREFIEWVLAFVDKDGAVRSLSFLANERLPYLAALLGAMQELKKGGGAGLAREARRALPDKAKEAAIMLYTGGMDGEAIAAAIGISRDDLERVWDDLLREGLATVARVPIALRPPRRAAAS